MDPRSLIHHLYPRLLALHDLEDTIAVPQEIEQPDGTLATQIAYPSCTRDTHTFMESGGLYVIGAFNFLASVSLVRVLR
jgi:protein transport protein SEC24